MFFVNDSDFRDPFHEYIFISNMNSLSTQSYFDSYEDEILPRELRNTFLGSS